MAAKSCSAGRTWFDCEGTPTVGGTVGEMYDALSSIQRVPAEVGWQISAALCSRSDSVTDRDLPLLVWYGIAPLVLQDLDRGFALADSLKIPAIHV